jgi:hypothetical protein
LQNFAKIIFKKAIFFEHGKDPCPAYTMTKANRIVFSRRLATASTPRGMKKLADPSKYSLKGDEWGDFIVTGMLFAVEGLVSQKIFDLLSLLREAFILCTQLRVMRTARIREVLKNLGKAIEKVCIDLCSSHLHR